MELTMFGAVYMSLFPELYVQMKALDLSVFRLVGLHLESPEGYVASVVLAYISLCMSVYCIVSSTATLAGAFFFFNRCDITAGAWPWQKGRSRSRNDDAL
jgi:hypothetical protein